MVRISTTYDKELNQKVFTVRGDEAYARTTDTLLTLTEYSNSDDSVEGYRVGYGINVLRDIGSSSVTLYDGDSVLAVYDYDDTIEGITEGDSSSGGLILTYGVDHDIWVKYNGNSQCLMSKSKHQIVNYPLPDKFKTEIAFTNTNASINEGADYESTLTVTVNGEGNLDRLHNLDILIYVDDVYNQTITTGDNTNTAELLIEDISNGGHMITAEIVESSTVHSVIKSTNLSVGHKVVFTEYPQIVYEGVTATFKGKVNDYFGRVISTGNMTLADNDGTTIATGSVSNNTTTITTTSAKTKYKLKYGNSWSDVINTTIGTISEINISVPSNNKVFYDGNTNRIYAQLSGSTTSISNVPITFTIQKPTGSPTTVTRYTNSSGEAYYEYTCTGVGAVTFTATYGSFSDTYSTIDYLWYANTSDNLDFSNVSYTTHQSTTITTTSQGFKISGFNPTYIIIPQGTASEDYASNINIKFDMKSTNIIGAEIISSETQYIAGMNVKENDTVELKFTRSSDDITIKYYKNNILMNTITRTASPNVKIGIWGHSPYYIDNFQVYRSPSQ